MENPEIIREVQRLVGNLHARASNYISSQRMEINGKEVTQQEVLEYLDSQTALIQEHLKQLK